METQILDLKNLVYPPGCYFVFTPNTLTFREPNTSTIPEMNFNKFMYFAPRPDGRYQLIPDKVIRDIIRAPETPWDDKLQGMVMIGPLGNRVPAHLSNLLDCVGIVDIVDVFGKLKKEDNMEDAVYDSRNISEIIPIFLESQVNPCPNIVVEGPVYPLKARKVETLLACYIDGFQIFYVHAKISEIFITIVVGRFKIDSNLMYMDVKLDCKYNKGSEAFELGSSIVVWNARSVTRPSFKDNMLKFVNVHKPIIFVIIEARVGRKSFEDDVQALDYEVDWSLDESVGLSGGVAVIWDFKKVCFGEFVVAGEVDYPLRQLGILKPNPAPEPADSSAC